MHTLTNICSEKQNTAAALGFFDGLHLGHRKVLSLAAKQEKCGLLPLCLTFAESPKAVMSGMPFFYLMTKEDKLRSLESIGIRRTVMLDFNAVMDMSAESFFFEILVKKLRVKELFCGFNYHFGKDAEGDIAMLQRLCDQNNVGITIVPPETMDGEVICSTLIKKLISEGEIERANDMLGSRFGFKAEIIHGMRLGRELGTPTLNQQMHPDLVMPRFGVYASLVTLENGGQYCGVTNIGIKPTVGGTKPLWETWMPEYRGAELYGEQADVRLLTFIRPEKKFDSLTLLREEIMRNARQAKEDYARVNSFKNLIK